jgi:hypothetical protein
VCEDSAGGGFGSLQKEEYIITENGSSVKIYADAFKLVLRSSSTVGL